MGEAIGLNEPKGIALYNDNLLVVDTKNDRIIFLDFNGNIVNVIGKTGSGEGEFIKPSAAAKDSKNNIYVADSGNGRVQIFNESGIFLKQIAVLSKYQRVV